MDEDAPIEYGADPSALALLDELMAAIGKFGKQQLATRIGISRNSLSKILDVKCELSFFGGGGLLSGSSRPKDSRNHESAMSRLPHHRTLRSAPGGGGTPFAMAAIKLSYPVADRGAARPR
jgi:hypothetical protein